MTAPRLTLLSEALHQATEQASASLARWLDRPASIKIDAVELVSIQEATQLLGEDETTICCCTTEVAGRLAGELILAFDNTSGLALADMLLDQPAGAATHWTELETSAALETTNIICCAYLNALSQLLTHVPHLPDELLPGPPVFRRDFAESVLESALMDQVAMGDELLLARAVFQIDGAAVNWCLVFVPDADSIADLRQLSGSQQQ